MAGRANPPPFSFTPGGVRSRVGAGQPLGADERHPQRPSTPFGESFQAMLMHPGPCQKRILQRHSRWARPGPRVESWELFPWLPRQFLCLKLKRHRARPPRPPPAQGCPPRDVPAPCASATLPISSGSFSSIRRTSRTQDKPLLIPNPTSATTPFPAPPPPLDPTPTPGSFWSHCPQT